MHANYVTISRDPFAREDIVRAVVDYVANRACSYCGGKNAHGKLFVYGVRPDSIAGRIHWQRGAFCSIDCCRAYHG